MKSIKILNTKPKKIIFLVVTLLLIINIYSWLLLTTGSWYGDPDVQDAQDRFMVKTETKACLQFDRTGFFRLKADAPVLPDSLSSGVVVLNSVKLELKNHSTNGHIRFFVNPLNSTLSAVVADPESMENRTMRFKWQKAKCQ